MKRQSLKGLGSAFMEYWGPTVKGAGLTAKGIPKECLSLEMAFLAHVRGIYFSYSILVKRPNQNTGSETGNVSDDKSMP